jgi:hypothetical protein
VTTTHDGDQAHLFDNVARARAWAADYLLPVCGCCGQFTDPPGMTGNTNCSEDGKMTLSDVSRLIDYLYISKEPLCCYASGNTNGSWDDGDCKITLGDVSRLIDHLYISKLPTEACMLECEQ